MESVLTVLVWANPSPGVNYRYLGKCQTATSIQPTLTKWLQKNILENMRKQLYIILPGTMWASLCWPTCCPSASWPPATSGWAGQLVLQQIPVSATYLRIYWHKTEIVAQKLRILKMKGLQKQIPLRIQVFGPNILIPLKANIPHIPHIPHLHICSHFHIIPPY